MASPVFGEFIGTFVLILLGDGVVAGVLLKGSKGENAGWLAITAGWAFAVFAGVFTAIAFGSADAHLNPGPNSPVGVVWIALSKPHYGIHGTKDPDSIGYASSHGCVRLTNYDADELRRRISEGVAVAFVDTSSKNLPEVAKKASGE